MLWINSRPFFRGSQLFLDRPLKAWYFQVPRRLRLRACDDVIAGAISIGRFDFEPE